VGKKMRICFAASSGGHFEQLLMLAPLMSDFESFIVTEKTKYNGKTDHHRTYYLRQVNRKELLFPFQLIAAGFQSFRILRRERPEVIICTGVLAMIPLCLIGKIMGSKLVYIESFAKVSTPTLTGRLLYHFADKFYVQWPELLSVYPKATYLGSVY